MQPTDDHDERVSRFSEDEDRPINLDKPQRPTYERVSRFSEDEDRPINLDEPRRPTKLDSQYGRIDDALEVAAADLKTAFEHDKLHPPTADQLVKFDHIIDKMRTLPSSSKGALYETMQEELDRGIDTAGQGHRDHVRPEDNEAKIEQVFDSIFHCISNINHDKAIKKQQAFRDLVAAKKAVYVALGIAATIVAGVATGGTILLAFAVVGLALAVSDLAVNMPAEAYGDLKEKYPKIQHASLTEKISQTAQAMMEKPLTMGVSALTLTGATILVAILFSPALIISAPITLPIVCTVLLIGAAITAVQVYNDYRQEVNTLDSEIKTQKGIQNTIRPPQSEPTLNKDPANQKEAAAVPTATTKEIAAARTSLHMTEGKNATEAPVRPSFQRAATDQNTPTPTFMKKQP